MRVLLIMFSSLPKPRHCSQSFCLRCRVSCITAPLFLCVSGRGIFQSYHYFQHSLYVHSRNACSRQFNLIYGLNRTLNVKMSVNHPRKYASLPPLQETSRLLSSSRVIQQPSYPSKTQFQPRALSFITGFL